MPEASAVASPEARDKTSSGAPGSAEKLHQWSLCLFELTLLQCRKRKAVEQEDFDFAHAIKRREVSAGSRLADARQSFLASAADASGGSASLASVVYTATGGANASQEDRMT